LGRYWHPGNRCIDDVRLQRSGAELVAHRNRLPGRNLWLSGVVAYQDNSSTVTIEASSLKSFRRVLLCPQMRESFAQQRAMIERRLVGRMGANIVEPRDNARQILPIRKAEIVYTHE